MKLDFDKIFNRNKKKDFLEKGKVRILEIEKILENLREEETLEKSNLEAEIEHLSEEEKNRRMLKILEIQKKRGELNNEKSDIERELRNGPTSTSKTQEDSTPKSSNKDEVEYEESKIDTQEKESVQEAEAEVINEEPNNENSLDMFVEDGEYLNENKTFKELSDEQKVFVMQSLKKRIIALVKKETEIQYSDYFRKKMKSKLTGAEKFAPIKKMFEKIPKGIRESWNKESNIKNIESEVYKNFFKTEEGKKLIEEDIEILSKNAKEKEIYFDQSEKKAKVLYVSMEEINNATPEERRVLINFNNKANEFRNIPYEWGQEEKGKLKNNKNIKTYEKVYEEYKKARSELLTLKTAKEGENEKGKGMLDISKIDAQVQLEQLFTTHPEFEKEFERLEEKAGGTEDMNRLKRIAKNVTGTNKLLFTLGFVARGVSKGVLASSKLNGFIAPVSFAIGGVLGSIRSRLKAKETLAKRKKDAREGKQDPHKEKNRTVDSVNLTKRMEYLLKALENASTEEEQAQRIEQINRRIHYTQKRIEQGLVNFGKTEESLKNKFEFTDNLNKALVAINGPKIIDLKTKLREKNEKDVDYRLAKYLDFTARKVDRNQQKFIRKQMVLGMAKGIGVATFGYVLRVVGENFGWWGNEESDHLTENTENPVQKPPETPIIPKPPEEEGIEIDVVTPIEDTTKPPETITPVEETTKPVSVENTDEKKITKKSIEKEKSEDYETDNGWNKVTEEELKKQDVIEQTPKNAELENEPTTKVQGSKITWTEGESGGDSIDENTSKVQGSKIVWTEGESGKINETSIPKEEIPEEKGEQTIEKPIEGESHEEYVEPKVEDENKVGALTEEEMAGYQEPKETEKIISEEIDGEKGEEYIEPVSEEKLKEGEAYGEEEYSEPVKNIEKQVDNEIPNKIEYTEPEKEVEVNSENSYGLNETQLQEIKTINTENLSKVFGEKMSTWDNIKVLPAHEDIESVGLTEQKQSFIKYLKKLREESGLEPKPETLVSKAETNEEYIKRVFAEMTKRGQLDKLKL